MTERTHDWWYAACDHLTDPSKPFPSIPASGTPQLGYFKIRDGRAAPWEPCAIFEVQGSLTAVRGFEQRIVEIKSLWPYCAKPDRVLSYEVYEAAMLTKAWPAAAAVEIEAPAAPEPTIGHNSGATDPIQEAMSAIAELTALYGKNYPAATTFATKADADHCEDLRKRLWTAAGELDAARKALNAKPQREIDINNARLKPVIDGALSVAAIMGNLCDRFARAEKSRLEDEASKAAADAFKAGAEARPIPDIKVNIGTGVNGRKRSTPKEADTYEIVDLVAAASHFAKQNHPEIVAAVRSIAARCAKGRKGGIPGIVMSFEGAAKPETEAAAQEQISHAGK